MKNARLYDVTGNSLAESTDLGVYEFMSIPRIGEKIVFQYNKVNMLYEVIEIIHSYLPEVGEELIYAKRVNSLEDHMNTPL